MNKTISFAVIAAIIATTFIGLQPIKVNACTPLNNGHGSTITCPNGPNGGPNLSSPTGTITCTGHTRTVTSADGRTVVQPGAC